MPTGEDSIVRREGDDREAAGRARARVERVAFELHGADGQIRQRDSYGNDRHDVPG